MPVPVSHAINSESLTFQNFHLNKTFGFYSPVYADIRLFRNRSINPNIMAASQSKSFLAERLLM